MTAFATADGAPPAASVVICAYNARARIDGALRSLRAQDLAEPFEVIVVDSGQDGTADHLAAAHPDVRVVRSATRLYPGPARNRGVAAARGAVVAFLPDDGAARPDWLRRRLDKHRAGFAAVGGAITNGTPRHPVGTAGYLLEYSALIPDDAVLADQALPHCLSYDRSLFAEHGTYPEDTETGEDTIFNRRLVRAGVPVGFDARIQLAHDNLRGVRPYLRHQYEHGRGLMQCVDRHAFASPVGPRDQSVAAAAWRIFAAYPALRWWHALRRLRRGGPRWAVAYVALTPLIYAGLLATAAGAWSEWWRTP